MHLLKELLEVYKDTLLSLESPLGSDYWHAVYLVGKRILEKLGYSEETAADMFAKTLDLSKTKEEIMNVTQAIKQEGLQEGLQQGLQEGLQEGLQQGLQEGLQQGMQEEKLVIARNLLRKNMDVSFITETTGLDSKTITRLKEDKA